MINSIDLSIREILGESAYILLIGGLIILLIVGLKIKKKCDSDKYPPKGFQSFDDGIEEYAGSPI